MKRFSIYYFLFTIFHLTAQHFNFVGATLAVARILHSSFLIPKAPSGRPNTTT